MIIVLHEPVCEHDVRNAIVKVLAYEITTNKDEMINQTALIGLNTSKVLAQTSSETEVGQKITTLLQKLNQTKNKTVATAGLRSVQTLHLFQLLATGLSPLGCGSSN